MAIGLMVVAAALLALTHHLRENRRLLVEARLMQDLRTASELIARDLRRAGHWNQSSAGTWRAESPNPVSALTVSDTGVSFAYTRSTDTDQAFVYRLQGGVIEMKIGGGHWQSMTDANTMRVSSLRITPQVQEITLEGFCSKPCPEASNTCPPRQALRSLAIDVEGQATTDPTVLRTARTTVRLRNDALIGACPT
jgi:type IV pilus assembly protein PilW